ncbi:MAG: hypothetical protein IKB27_05435 [Clostridia bacterium]|nr:hypothetical protein [Clostridia bacterium]
MKKLLMLVALMMALCLCACNTPLPPNGSGTQTGNGSLTQDEGPQELPFGSIAKIMSCEPTYFDTYLELDSTDKEYIGNAIPETGEYFQVLTTLSEIHENVAGITSEEQAKIGYNNYLVVIREVVNEYEYYARKIEYGFKDLRLTKCGATISQAWYEKTDYAMPDVGLVEPKDFIYTYHYLLVPKDEISRIVEQEKITCGKIVTEDVCEYTSWNGWEYSKGNERFFRYDYVDGKQDIPDKSSFIIRYPNELEQIREEYPNLTLPENMKFEDTIVVLYLEETSFEPLLDTFNDIRSDSNNIYLDMKLIQNLNKETKSRTFFIYVSDSKIEDINTKYVQLHFLTEEYVIKEKI